MKRVIALFVVILFIVAAAVGCSPQNNTSSQASSPPAVSPESGNSEKTSSTSPEEEKSDPTPLSILAADNGRVVMEDNPQWLALEEATNTNITMQLLAREDITAKLNTLAASSTMPDIVQYLDWYEYAAQGLMYDISDLVTEENVPNLLKWIPESLWDYTTYKGQLLAVPFYNQPGKTVMSVRSDWLEKVNKEVPTNLEELKDVLLAFANEDPDGNGEKDSYGIAYSEDLMSIFGAFGLMDGRRYYIEDNKSYTTTIAPEYKDFLAYMNELWNLGVIDPDYLTMQSDQYWQKLAQGKVGMLTAGWSIIPQYVIGQLGFEEMNPDGEWEIIDLPVGPGGPYGNQGVRSKGDYSNALWLSADTKYPLEALQFLDYFFTDKGYYLNAYGIEGVHYTISKDNGRPVYTAEGQAGVNERWLTAFGVLMGRRIDLDIALLDPDDLGTQYTLAAKDYPLYVDAFFGMPTTQADLTYNADVKAFEEQGLIEFMTGDRSIDEYDAYVQEWLDLGGREILKEQTEQYNEMKGTNYTPGMQ